MTGKYFIMPAIVTGVNQVSKQKNGGPLPRVSGPKKWIGKPDIIKNNKPAGGEVQTPQMEKGGKSTPKRNWLKK